VLFSDALAWFDHTITRISSHEFGSGVLNVKPNYPEPFSDYTIIEYTYTKSEPEWIGLKVFNSSGQLMRATGKKAKHGSDHFIISGDGLMPGIYFYRLFISTEFHTGAIIKTE